MADFKLAHLSDLHITKVRIQALKHLLSKRALGALSWNTRRRNKYRPEILASLIGDLHQQNPDHVVVTGDLTNVALEDEFSSSLSWLEKLGGPELVSLVPGNHDVYVPESKDSAWNYWGEYMRSHQVPNNLQASFGFYPGKEFPTVRICGATAIVGVSTATATHPLSASGTIGELQLSRLEQILDSLTGSGLCRVVLLHHPPQPLPIARRRRLTDAAAFRTLIAKVGAELILHGHAHKRLTNHIDGPRQSVPVCGVRPSSAAGQGRHRAAQYHIYKISRNGSVAGSLTKHAGFEISVISRSYNKINKRFEWNDEQSLQNVSLDQKTNKKVEADQKG